VYELDVRPTPECIAMLKSHFQILSVALVLLVQGCVQDSKQFTTIDLGSTGITVTLLGPDEKRHYRYRVSDGTGARLDRFLGPAQVSSPTQAQITDEGSGRFRVAWGSGTGAAFALIDTKLRRVISDTNQANHEQPF
jgi:hypothetical protein